jgi:hypothetical protein
MVAAVACRRTAAISSGVTATSSGSPGIRPSPP